MESSCLIFFAFISQVLSMPDVSHLAGYQYDSPHDNNDNSANGHSSVGTSMIQQHNQLFTSEDIGTGSIFHGISSYEAPLNAVSENNVASFGNVKNTHETEINQRVEDTQIHRGETRVIDLSGGSSESAQAFKTVYKEGPPEITKSIYIHEAKEDEPKVRFQQKQVEVRPKKHYKIIFVKVPTENGFAGRNANPLYAQDEEKTIIYVLSKKNDFTSDDGEIATPPPPVTSKPEVFFIKYKNQDDSESVVRKIQESYHQDDGGQFADAFTQNAASHSDSSNRGYSPNESVNRFSNSGDAVVRPQQLVEAPKHQSAISANYLPPNRRI